MSLKFKWQINSETSTWPFRSNCQSQGADHLEPFQASRWTKIDDATEIAELDEEELDGIFGRNQNQSASCEDLDNIMGLVNSKRSKVGSQSVPDIPARVKSGGRKSESQILDQDVLKEIDKQSVPGQLYNHSSHSSSIDLNSILHRSSEFYITKSSDSKTFIYSELNDSSNVEQLNKLEVFDKKVSNAILPKKIPNHRVQNNPKVDNSRPLSMCRRLGQSIQNLVWPIEPRGISRKSVSEVNLSKQKPNNFSDKSQSYCPSVLFSRNRANRNAQPSGHAPSKMSNMRKAWKRLTNFNRKSSQHRKT